MDGHLVFYGNWFLRSRVSTTVPSVFSWVISDGQKPEPKSISFVRDPTTHFPESSPFPFTRVLFPFHLRHTDSRTGDGGRTLDCKRQETWRCTSSVRDFWSSSWSVALTERSFKNTSNMYSDESFYEGARRSDIDCTTQRRDG